MSGSAAHDAAVARLKRALESRVPQLAERDEPYKEAAVALVLRPGLHEDDLELLLIRRAEREGDPWSGQIGLPGGRLDKSDASLEAAAIRETMEEVGLDLSVSGQVLGALDELRPRTPVLPPIIVRPFIAVVRETPPLTPSHEVAEMRWVRVNRLFAPETRVNTTVQVREYRMRVDAYQLDDFTVWGMTERILTTFGEIWR